MTNQALFELCGFDTPTRALAALYCNPNADAMGRWLSDADFDSLPAELTCMAASAASKAGFDAMPQAPVPRLRGLIKYVHTLNAGMSAALICLAGALHQEGIDLILLEDTAIALSSGGQHQLWQLRIGVAKRNFDRAVDIAHSAGWVGDATAWAATLKQGLTGQLTPFPLAESSYLWENATPLQLGNTNLLLPEPAAILLGLCQLGFRALMKPSPRSAMVHWVMDMRQLLASFDESHWQRALLLARQEKALFQMGLLLHIYAGLCPGAVIPEKFCTLADAQGTAGLLQAFRALPEKGHKLRKACLLCRLRHPDSRIGAMVCFATKALKKLTP